MCENNIRYLEESVEGRVVYGLIYVISVLCELGIVLSNWHHVLFCLFFSLRLCVYVTVCLKYAKCYNNFGHHCI